jgi:hypothetical protein
MDAGRNEFVIPGGPRRRPLALRLRELLGRSRRFWLLPFALAVLIVAALVLLGHRGAVPFVYTLH